MNKKVILFSVLGAIFLIVITAGGILAFLHYSPWASELMTQNKTPETHQETVEPAITKKPLFKPLEKFVISVDGDNTRRYLMLELTLVTHNQEQFASYDDYMPVIRNSLVQYFSPLNETQVSEELHHVDKLELDLQTRLSSTLQNYGFKPSLDEVLITKYVVQ